MVLTLHEPWASLVACSVKRHETRRWSTRYRGVLLVHAAKVWGRKQRARWESLARALSEAGVVGLPAPRPGLILCRCVVTGCLPTAEDRGLFPEPAEPFDGPDRLCGDWGPGRWAIRLDAVRPLPAPIPWSGTQGRPRSAPPLLVAAVNEQLGAIT